MDLNITNLLSNTSVSDDELLDVSGICKALGPPDKPVDRRTVSREFNRPDGLEWVEVAGRKYSRVGALRERVRSRMKRPNQRREGRQNGRTS